MHHFGRLLRASVMFLCMPLAASGQEGSAQPGPAPWGAFCTGESRHLPLDCQIEQRVVVSNSGQLLTAVVLKMPRSAGAPTLLVQTPFGLHLPSGLRLAVDDADVLTLPLRTCDATGCYAEAAANDDLVAAMRRGNTLTVAFKDVRENEIAVPVSLLGFSAALDKAR